MEQSKAKVLPLPDTGDVFFILVMALLLFIRPNFLLGDGSTGRHIFVGNYILDKHVVPYTDILSFTCAGKPWVDFEWLADLISAILVRCGGLNLLTVVASAFIALLTVLVYQRASKTGCNFILVVILAILGIIASSVHWLARPHLITFLGVYLFSTMLEDFVKGTLRGVKLVGMLAFGMVVWVNCHPGFLSGLGLIGIYLFCNVIQRLFLQAKDNDGKCSFRIKWLSLGLMSTILASLCNPYGLEIYRYIFSLVNERAILDVFAEYRSPVFHGDVQSCSLAMLFAFLVVGLTITTRPFSLSQLMTAIAFCYLSLYSIRNLPLFVIVVLPLIAQLYSQTIFQPDDEKNNFFPSLNYCMQKVLLYAQKLDFEFRQIEGCCRMHLLPIISFVLLLFICFHDGKIYNQVVLNSNFDSSRLPSHTLIAINQLKLEPKQGFNFDNWGGCLNFSLGIPVFIDDRPDLFGAQFCFDYATILNALPGWRELLKKDGIKWALIPNDSRFGFALQNKLNWKLAEKDEVAPCMLRAVEDEFGDLNDVERFL